jgi:hypothetical protein
MAHPYSAVPPRQDAEKSLEVASLLKSAKLMDHVAVLLIAAASVAWARQMDLRVGLGRTHHA